MHEGRRDLRHKVSCCAAPAAAIGAHLDDAIGPGLLDSGHHLGGHRLSAAFGGEVAAEAFDSARPTWLGLGIQDRCAAAPKMRPPLPAPPHAGSGGDWPQLESGSPWRAATVGKTAQRATALAHRCCLLMTSAGPARLLCSGSAWLRRRSFSAADNARGSGGRSVRLQQLLARPGCCTAVPVTSTTVTQAPARFELARGDLFSRGVGLARQPAAPDRRAGDAGGCLMHAGGVPVTGLQPQRASRPVDST